VLAGLTIFAFSFIPLFWFIGAIANALRLSGESRLAATAVGLLAGWAGAQLVLQHSPRHLRSASRIRLTRHQLGR
jgi:hypothetical protein